MKKANTNIDPIIPGEELIELSAIKIFDSVQKSISEIDVWPLNRDHIDVHEDAYHSLASDDENDFGFAHIGIEYTRRYTDLAFGMIFSKHQVGLSIGGLEYVFNPYHHLGGNEKAIARRLVNILIGLSNGQLAILNTVVQDEEKVQAWELLYRRPDKQLYDALATYYMFDSKRKLKNKQLTTQKLANTADIESVEVDIDVYKAFAFETTWLNKFNRTQIAGLHVPLTVEEWERNVDEYYDKKFDTTPKKTKSFLEKVDRWASSDNQSLWHKILDAAKWRHLELLWWSLAVIIYPLIVAWSLEDFHPSMIIFGAFVIGATVYRQNPKFYEHFPLVRVSAYFGFFLAAYLFYLNFDSSVWWYILAILGVGSFIENAFFDIYNAVRKPEPKTD